MFRKTIIILSVSSDIGKCLARNYAARGWKVIGTYRNSHHLGELKKIPQCELIRCDVKKKADIGTLVKYLTKQRVCWQRFISCVGNLLPATKFFDSPFDVWQKSIEVNALGQLHALHAVYPFRDAGARVVFFAGGGVNHAVTDITAYTASKIMLTKMVEYLDAENKDMSFIIVGPGWTKTKIHDDILKDLHVARSKKAQTKHDLRNKPSTSLEEIDQCIEWLCALPKRVVSGRNFSVVYDPWKGKDGHKLVKALTHDPHMYKLRRLGS